MILPSQLATIYLARAPKAIGNDLWEYALGVHDADGIVALDLAFRGIVEDAVVKSVAVTGLSASFQAASNPVGNELLVALYGISPMLGSGEFLIVTVQQPGGSSGVTFELSGQANEGLIPLAWEPGLSGERPARPASADPVR